MRIRTGRFLTLAASTIFLGTAVPGSAAAGPGACNAATSPVRMTEADLRDKVTALRYEIWRIELDDGCYEVEARDSNGAHVELELDAVTGELVGWERED